MKWSAARPPRPACPPACLPIRHTTLPPCPPRSPARTPAPLRPHLLLLHQVGALLHLGAHLLQGDLLHSAHTAARGAAAQPGLSGWQGETHQRSSARQHDAAKRLLGPELLARNGRLEMMLAAPLEQHAHAPPPPACPRPVPTSCRLLRRSPRSASCASTSLPYSSVALGEAAAPGTPAPPGSGVAAPSPPAPPPGVMGRPAAAAASMRSRMPRSSSRRCSAAWRAACALSRASALAAAAA